MIKVKVENKYITQKIHQMDNLNLIIENETTELIVDISCIVKNLNIFLDLSSFTNLKKLVIDESINKSRPGKFWKPLLNTNGIMYELCKLGKLGLVTRGYFFYDVLF